jgi:hypothetical protein
VIAANLPVTISLQTFKPAFWRRLYIHRRLFVVLRLDFDLLWYRGIVSSNTDGPSSSQNKGGLLLSAAKSPIRAVLT